MIPRPPRSTLFPCTTLFRSRTAGTRPRRVGPSRAQVDGRVVSTVTDVRPAQRRGDPQGRSEEHTFELQSRQYLVCRLLLEKKKIHSLLLSSFSLSRLNSFIC